MRSGIRLLAVLLACSLYLGNVRAAEILPRREHKEMTLEETEALHFSAEDFTGLVEETEQAGAAGDRDRTGELLHQVRDLYQIMETELELSDFRNALDATDMEGAENTRRLRLQSYQVWQQMNDLICGILEGPCADLVDPEDEVFYQFGAPSEPMDPEEEALYDQEQALIDNYYLDASQPATVAVRGVEYDGDSLYDAWLEGIVSDRDYDQASLSVAKADNEALADYYIALVENRQAQAARYGWDDYAEMADESYYYRDYSRREIRAFSQRVKAELVPLMQELREDVEGYAQAGAYTRTFTEQELLVLLSRGIGTVSEELRPALDYMMENGYYDISAGPGKISGAYTTYLSFPRAPLLMMNPAGDDTDFTTLVHEFGHYNAFFTAEYLDATNMDLSEIHSQGLELLMMDDYDRVFGADADAEREYTLYSMVDAMVSGCMMDELERFAYGEADLTVEKMNMKYMALLKEYGYRDQEDPEIYGYDWVNTAHLFSQPLYYLSYAVSAAGALTIWQQSLTDREGAVDCYLRLVAQGELDDFYPTLERVGMADPLAGETISALAEAIRGTEEELSPPNKVLQTALAVGMLLVLVLPIIWIVKRGRKRDYDKLGDGFYEEPAGAAVEGGRDDRDPGDPAQKPDGAAGGREGYEELPAAGTDHPPV